MPDETIVVGSGFDDAGAAAGIAHLGDLLDRFADDVASLKLQLPGVDVQAMVASMKVGTDAQKAALQDILATYDAASAAASKPIITRDKMAEIKTLSAVLTDFAISEEAAAKGATNMAAGWKAAELQAAQLTRTLGRAQQGNDAWNRGMQNIVATSQAATGGFHRMGHSSRQTAQHFVTMAAASLGADTAIARMAATVLSMSVGFGKIAIGAGVIFAIALAYEKLTESTRKAREEQEKLLEAQKQRLQEAGDPGALQRTIIADQIRLQKITEEMRRVTAQTDALGIAPSHHQRVKLLELENEQLLVQLGLHKDIDTVARGRVESQLAAARQGAADAAALEAAANRAATALAKFRADVAAQGRQTFTMDAGQTGVAASQTFLSDQEIAAFQRRTQLQKEATEDMVRALQLEAALLPKLAVDVDETAKRDRQTKLNQLEAAVRLRQLEGDEALDLIEREKQLLALTRTIAKEQADHLNRVAAAGGGNLLGQNPATVTVPARDAFAEHKAALPAILQGRVQAGIESMAEGYAGLVVEIKKARIESLRFAQAQKDARTEFEQMADAMDQLVRGGFEILNAAQNIGLIGDTAADSIGSVLQLGSAIGNLRDELGKISVGGVLGLVASGLNLVEKVFSSMGPSPEHDAILAENNVRLEELRHALDESLRGNDALVRAGAATMELIRQNAPIRADPDTALIVRTGSIEEINEILAEFGLNLDQLNKIAKDNGINLLDKKGRVVADAFDQLSEALELSIQAALEFGKTLADWERLQDTREKLGVIPERSDLERNRDVVLEGLNLGPAWEAWVASLDLDTAEGREAYLKFIRTVLAMAEAGQLTIAELGKFGDVDELLGPLGEAADAAARAAEAEAAAALELEEAAKAAADAALELAKEMERARIALGDEIRARLSVRGRLTGDTDASDIFHQALVSIGIGSNDFLIHLFDALGSQNFADETVREKLRQQLIAWIDLADAGVLKPEDLGLTAEQFQQFLEDAADYLDSFNESVQEATKSLLNLPVGFNLAAFEFNAQLAGGRVGQPAEPSHPGVGSWTPGGVPAKGPGSTAWEGEGPPINRVNVESVVINVVGTNKSPQEIAREVARELALLHNATSGTPDNTLTQWPR